MTNKPGFVFILSDQNCFLNFQDISPETSPLILQTSGEWITPESDDGIEIQEGNSVLVSCPGTKFKDPSISLFADKITIG
jgi:hypothetical protein